MTADNGQPPEKTSERRDVPVTTQNVDEALLFALNAGAPPGRDIKKWLSPLLPRR